MNALRAALRIFSGKKILNFGFQESLRTFLKPIFTGRGLGPTSSAGCDKREKKIKFPLIMVKANAAAI